MSLGIDPDKRFPSNSRFTIFVALKIFIVKYPSRKFLPNERRVSFFNSPIPLGISPVILLSCNLISFSSIRSAIPVGIVPVSSLLSSSSKDNCNISSIPRGIEPDSELVLADNTCSIERALNPTGRRLVSSFLDKSKAVSFTNLVRVKGIDEYRALHERLRDSNEERSAIVAGMDPRKRFCCNPSIVKFDRIVTVSGKGPEK
mmetsp:Transcript_19858/g.19965  ORF Transcript_19858/g.19965 Transcript_19858/m.19965 type:complete len:202 (+) Transcript_19858:3564-4169(+)